MGMDEDTGVIQLCTTAVFNMTCENRREGSEIGAKAEHIV